MKGKKIFIIIAIIAGIVFFFIIDIIKGIQTNRNKTDSERFIEALIPQEVYTFDEILNKADFGQFISVALTPSSGRKNSPLYDTALEKGVYIYSDENLAKQVLEVLKKYEYIYPVKDISFDESCEFVYGLGFRADNNVNLIINVNTTANKDIQLINISADDEFASLNYTWFENHPFGLLVDGALSEEIAKILIENTRKISLPEVRQIISKNTGEMPWTSMFQYEKTHKQNYINHAKGDCYSVYEYELADSNEYLLTYAIDMSVSGDENAGGNKKFRYIFKIELYGEDDSLKEVLYDDMERYNHDVKGIE